VTARAAQPAAPPAEALRPPQSWKPAAREEWAKTSPAVQAEVLRREKESYAREQEVAPLRRFAQEFHAVVSPFEASIRAEGGEPLSAVRELLQTSHALRTAPSAHKAQLVANIVRTFDVDIRALDNALADGPAAVPQGRQAQPQTDVRSHVTAAIREIQQQAVATRAQKDVAAFVQGKEFIEDVKPVMVALLHSKPAITLDEAYDEACWANKEIRGILQRREAVAAANASTASTQRARAAASSGLRTQPASASAPQPDTIDADIHAAIASLSGR
jgi:hypothetical protein